MNWYKKLDTYLLERYPIIWNTNFVWLMLLGLVLHGIFYACGYGYMDLDLLKKSYLGLEFFNSSFFGLYIVLCLLAFIYFAFRYYTHNPFRHFYKLGKFYFLKNFVSIAFLLWLWSLIPISFNMGMTKKTVTITSESQLRKEMHAFNLAYPFFFVDRDHYRIENRSYPTPFPLQEISEFEIGRDSQNQGILHGIAKDKAFITFGTEDYQFAIVLDSVIDECKSKEYIDSIVDVSAVYGLAEYSIFNFSENFIDINNFIGKDYNREIEQFETKFQKEGGISNIEYVKNTHKWMLERNETAIKNAIENVNKICQRYKIYSNLNPSKIATDVFAQDLNDRQLISVGQAMDKVDFAYEGETLAEAEVEGSKQLTEKNYRVGMNDFRSITENFSQLQMHGSYIFNSEVFNLILIFSLLFAFAIIILKHLHFLNVLIGIAIAAVLGGVFSVIGISTDILDNGSHETSLTFYIIFLAIVLAVSFYYVRSKHVSKRISGFAYLPFAISSGLFMICIFSAIIELSKVGVYNKCSGLTNYETTYDIDFFHVNIALFALIIFAFYLLKKFHAKPE